MAADPTYITVEGRASAEIVEKKSRFIAQVAHVETDEEAVAFLEEVRAAHRMARHNVYAYVLRAGGRMRYSDDGEPQKTAGLPTLEVVRHAGISDVAIVTTRYFGGILLGTGGLVRAYTQSAQAALDAARLVAYSRCVDMEVELPYSFYEQALRIVEAHGAKVLDTSFTDRVALSLRMLAEAAPPLRTALTELTRAEAFILESEPLDAPF